MIKYILITLFLFNIVYSKQTKIQNNYTMLFPKDISNLQDRSGNVIQGISYIDDMWISTQVSKYGFILVNFYNKKGKSIFRNRIYYPSHAQDLSVEKNKNQLLLYTSSRDWQGVTILYYDYYKNKIRYQNKLLEINLGCKHCTISLSNDRQYIIAKDKGYIHIYNKKIILEKGNTKNALLKKFKLYKEKEKIHYQGIVMYNNLIFILVSNSDLFSKKILYIYNIKGKLLSRVKLNSLLEEVAFKEGNKYEYEGLAIKDNKLYTTVMTGKNGNNKKRLVELLDISHAIYESEEK